MLSSFGRSGLVIGVGAGIVSTVLIVGSARGELLLRFLLSLLALQPALLAGLGWGWAASLVAGVVGFGCVALFVDPRVAVAYAGTVALPACMLAYLTGLFRQTSDASEPSSAARPEAMEWYPIGRILTAALLLTICLAVIFALFLGSDIEATRKWLRRMLEFTLGEMLRATSTEAAGGDSIAVRLDSWTETALLTMPGVAAATWLASFVFNLWLAGRVTAASGRLARPWPDLATIELPAGFPLLLAIGLFATFQPGLPGLLGSAVAGAILLAYAMIGLAIFHHCTRGSALRPLILSALYASVLVLNIWSLLAIAVVGLTERFSPLRRRLGVPPDRT